MPRSRSWSSAGFTIIYIVLGMFFGFSLFAGGSSERWVFDRYSCLYPVTGLVCLILWILLMVKAYQGERFRVPIAADIAEKIFGVVIVPPNCASGG